MLTCSLNVWPASYSLADEIQIPIKFDFRPFDTESNLVMARDSPISCSVCGAIATALFPQLDGIMTCPFCQTSGTYVRDESCALLKFQRETESGQAKLFLCFLVDLNCSEDMVDVSKIYLFVALKALLPGTLFIVGLLEGDRVSFVKVFNNGAKFLTFSVKSSLFDVIDVEFLVNSVNNIEIIEQMISKFHTARKFAEIDDIVDFSPLFSNAKHNTFVKFIVFSPHSIDPGVARKMSLDWFSPFPNKTKSMPIDGIFLTVNSEDVELHLQTLVQRYKTTDFAMDLSVQAFIAKPLEITPNSYTLESTRDGASQTLTVTIPRSYHRADPVPVQLEARYVVLSRGEKCIHRTTVISKRIPVSRDIAPVLQGINPVIVKESLTKDKEEPFLRRLLGLYNSRIVETLPGSAEYDPFFRMMPHLQLFLRFFAAPQRVTSSNLILGRDHAIARFIPCVSFWETQDEKIEEAAPAPAWSISLYPSVECIVADCGDKIHLFMDGDVRVGSQLHRDLERRIQRRFPIVPIQKHEKMRASFFIQSEREVTEIILKRFGKKRQ